MTLHLLVVASWGLAMLLGALGCGDVIESSGSFGTLSRDTPLGALDDDGQAALCDATEDLREEIHAEPEAARGACLLQISNDVRVALFSIDLNPERYSLDAIVADCEAAMARCVDEGPMHQPCTTIEFESSCQATVGDYERCIESTMMSLVAFAELDCDRYVRSEEARDRLRERVLDGLRGCTQQVVNCEGEAVPAEIEDPSWSDGGFGRLEEDAGDTLSNTQWLEELTADVEAFERPECETELEHDPALDAVAASIAADPQGEKMLGLDVLAQWKWLRNDSLEAVRERIQAFLDEEASACTWLGYGLAVHGEPGESRETVLLITE